MSSSLQPREHVAKSRSQAVTDLAPDHSDLHAHNQPLSSCACSASSLRPDRTRRGELIPSARISFEDTPTSNTSSRGNHSTTTFPSHSTAYAIYNRSASRLEGFPYRGSLWEAQLKDHPRGRLSHELGVRKFNESTHHHHRHVTRDSHAHSEEADGSLESSDADLDLSIELISPDTSYGTPGRPSQPLGCSSHTCSTRAEFTSIPMVGSSTDFTSSSPTHQATGSGPQPQSPSGDHSKEMLARVPSSPSEQPYDACLDSPLALTRTLSSTNANFTQAPHRARGALAQDEISNHQRRHCDCGLAKGFAFNPTPSIGQPSFQSRRASGHAPPETADVPPTPALTHADEEEDLEPMEGHYTPDPSDHREQLRDPPDIDHHPTLQWRRRSSVGSDPLRILIESNLTCAPVASSSQTPQPPPLVSVALLTSPSLSSHPNSPASFAAFSSPHLSTAPTSPSIYSPRDLRGSVKRQAGSSNQDLGLEQRLRSDDQRNWVPGSNTGGWRALSDFFSVLAHPHVSSRRLSAQKDVTTDVSPVLSPTGLISRLSQSSTGPDAIESLAEPGEQVWDDAENSRLYHFRRAASTHSYSSSSRHRLRWKSSDPCLPLPIVGDRHRSTRRDRTATSSLVLNPDCLPNLQEDQLRPTSSEHHLETPYSSPGRRGRTASVPIVSVTSPEEEQAETRRNKRITWQTHKPFSASHSSSLAEHLQPPRHLHQISPLSNHRQRLGSNVGGLPTIPIVERSRTNRQAQCNSPSISRSLCPPGDRLPHPRPTSKLSDSESSLVRVERHVIPGAITNDCVRPFKLGDQRSSIFKPILVSARPHSEARSVIGSQRSADSSRPASSNRKVFLRTISQLVLRLLRVDTRGRGLRSLLTAASARRSTTNAWSFTAMLERADPAAVSFWLGCLLGPWFFILGGWYLSTQHGELGQARSKPRLLIRSRNMANGHIQELEVSGLSWIMANRVAAWASGPLVMSGFIWSLVIICTS